VRAIARAELELGTGPSQHLLHAAQREVVHAPPQGTPHLVLAPPEVLFELAARSVTELLPDQRLALDLEVAQRRERVEHPLQIALETRGDHVLVERSGEVERGE
jgi:hypothetical protein